MHLVKRCVDSLCNGTVIPNELIVVVDSNPSVETALREELSGKALVVPNRGSGASEARNTGLALVASDIVAYLDDDADPEAGWLEAVIAAFERRPTTVGVGGRVVPEYEPGARPLPPEVLWIVGCTYRGHRTDEGPISRPIGANMAFRASAVSKVGGFPSAFGPNAARRTPARRRSAGKEAAARRVPGWLDRGHRAGGGHGSTADLKTGSNEELALAATLRRKFGDECLHYCPRACVKHFVPRARLTARYLVSRCWVEGTTKADITALQGRAAMSDDQRYLFHVLLPGIAGRLLTAARQRDRAALLEALVLAAAAQVTAAGYATRTLAYTLPRPSRS
jgi:glucosyl-dolichyl phosphate glucuronosyltransferase